MTEYINISCEWGGRTKVTPEDYKEQDRLFGVSAGPMEVLGDGIYIKGEKVAEAVKSDLVPELLEALEELLHLTETEMPHWDFGAQEEARLVIAKAKEEVNK